MSSKTNDKELVKKLEQDDEKAFRQIYDKYHEPIYGIAFKYLKSKELAEDAVHDVFVKLWNYRDELDKRSLKGFLFTTTKNHVLNMIRDRKRDIEKNQNYSHLKSASTNRTISQLTFKSYKKIFKAGLEKLPEGKKEIFNLKMNTGISNKDIAQKLDISVNTVKSQYYKASQFIKSYLDEHTDLDFE